MRRFWMLLLAVVALAALLAVPVVTAEEVASLSPESIGTQVVPADSAIGTCLYARPADMSAEAWAAFEALVRGETPKLTCADPEVMQLTFEENGIYIRSAAEVWHCICGANIGESHIGQCQGYAVKWTEHPLTGANNMPSKVGYWYLVDADSDPSDNTAEVYRTNLTNRNGIYVDFRGVTVIQGQIIKNSSTGDNIRFGNIWSDTTTPMFLSYTDSSQGHTGKLVIDSNGQKDDGTYDHSNIWLRGKDGDTPFGGVTMNCYRLTVDCSTKTNRYSSGFAVSAGTFLNLYECHVTGGTAVESYGGAITNSGTTTVVGGSITGGSATTNGATIYNAGTLVLDGVEISGGTAARYGGAVYVAGGSVTARNGTVINGGTAAEGGAVYIAAGASFTLDDSEVKNGISTRDAMGDEKNTATDDNLNDGKGSNFYVLGTLNVQNGSVIRDGTVNVLHSSTTFDNDDGNDYGGSAIYLGKGANAAVTDSEIHGYTGAKLWKRAGTIFNVKGTLTLTNTTVTGTAVNIDSGVIWNNGGTVHMTGGSLDASNLNKCQGLTKITYGGAVRNSGGGIFNLNSGTIQGFKTDSTNGGAAVYNGSSSTFNQKGGTIRGVTTISKGIGGAVAVAGGTFTMTGGTIQGGQAQKGGSVYVDSGTFDMKKGTIQGGQAVYGGNVFVNGGTFKMNGAESVITLGEARYNAAGNSSTFAYGGNVYMAGGTFTMTGGSTVTYGACFAKSATGWSPGGNVYISAGTLNVTGSTISHGQDTIAGLSQGGVDGNNLYINYNATVNLNSGTVIHNTVSNSQENILIQGGTLNIAEGCSITNKEGAVCRNLVANRSALTNTKKDENDKEYYHFDYVGKAPRINMSGGIITGGRSADGGGNVLLSHLSVFNMTGGTIENGIATNGGANIYVEPQPGSAIVKAYNEMFPDATKTAEELAGQVHISGDAKIIGGSIDGIEKNGGSIFMGDGTTLTILGTAEVYGGESAWCAGNIYANGFVTIGENAKVYDGKARHGSNQPNIYIVSGQLTLEGNAQISGGVGAFGSTATVTLKGSPVVDEALTGTGKQLPSEGLKLLEGATLVFDGLAGNAQIDLLCGAFEKDGEAFYTLDEATKGYIISGVIGTSDLNGITYESREFFLGKTADDKLVVVPKADAVGAVFSESSWLYDLPTAISLVTDSTQWVQMLSDYTGDLTVAKDLRLDMNGHSITGDVDNSGYTLYLLDSANADYTYNNGKLAGAVSGTVQRDFTTGKLAGYGHNYRFLVLKDKNGSYSAHRIYLTVKSTVLYPLKPALNYRTVLKCDSVVADYINNGGAYGVKITAVNGDTTYETAYSNYTEEGIAVVAAATGDNNYITQLNNILALGWDMDKQKLYTESVLNTNAYIRLTDFFYSTDVEEDITSGKVAKSFKEAVLEADKADPNTLTIVQKAALGDMYSSFTQLMSTWNLENVSSEEYRKHKVRYYCQCGDPDSEENPCADRGHKPQAWSQWTDATSLPTGTGNYYLSCDVKLEGQVTLKEGQFICIDTNGFDITSEGRIAYVKGDDDTTVLNFSNSKWESDVSVLSAKGVAYNGTDGGDGGILLMHGGSNVSLYKGVKLQLAEGHGVDRGGLIMNEGGDINIYGAELVGAELVSSENANAGNGGAVYMIDGYLYINSGSITGGKAVKGGAVYGSGELFVEGEAKISDGASQKLGGNVYLYGKKDGDAKTLLVLGEDAVIENGEAGENGNNIYLDSYAEAQIFGTVRNTLSGGTYTTEDGGSYTVSLNSVYVGTINSELILEETGSIVNEKAEGAEVMPCGRNVFVNSGFFTMNGGSISGGYTLADGDSGANVYVNKGTYNATFVMNGGRIQDGVYGFTADTTAVFGANDGGGNLFVKGIFQMHGGTVSGGKCLASNAKDSSNKDVAISGHGGNVLIYGGEVTLDGTARIENGKVAYSGGNVYITENGKLTMDSENASVAGGMSTWYNGGNIFVSTGCTFTLKAGTVSDGITRDGGGNVYANGTIDMRGGRMTGGMSAARWEDYTDYASEITSYNASATNACVFLVNGNFLMSGGEIDTGVGSTRTSNSARTIKLSGNAKIGGTGLNLGATTDKNGVYCNLDVVDGTELGENAEIYIRSGILNQFGDYLRLNVALDDVAYLKRLFKEAEPLNCQVAYLTAEEAPDGQGGIYLVNTKAFRYKCLCGANAGESHLPGCDGKQIPWNAWTTTSLPTAPGYWYLRFSTPTDGTYEGESVKYRAFDGSTLKYDYYQDENGNWVPVRALMKVDEFGNFIEKENGSYEQALDANGNPIWLNSAATAIDTAATGKVVESYGIHVDLNGYKLEGPAVGRILSFYGRSSYTLTDGSEIATALGSIGVYDEVTTAEDGTETTKKKFSTHRQGEAVYTIIDSSEDHTAVLGSYGLFSGKERTYKGDPQGTNIWLTWQGDTLNTYRISIDASSVKLGWGMALTTNGTVNLYDTEIVGGVAQAYFSKNELTQGSNGESGYVKTVGGGITGGGAVHISSTGTVNMFGGTIRDGIALYRYMDGSSGVDYDRSIGGGNVFVDGVFNVSGTEEYPAAITGGMALEYVGDDKNPLSYYRTSQGGGVYLYQGKMTVSGEVDITGNFCGTATGTEDQTNGIVGEYASGHITDIVADDLKASNVFLNGNTMEAQNLTGTVGFTMNGSVWEGVFAKVDTGDASYVTNGNLVPDAAQSVGVVCVDDYLRYVHNTDKLQVGYGAYSIYPEEQDIINGLSLGGYGNNNYTTSQEMARITRYWKNTGEKTLSPTLAKYTIKGNEDWVDMKAVAMAFRDTEGDTVIIINVDYNNVSEAVGNRVKLLVSKATGVPQSNITISASHQHNGPAIGKYYWTNMDGAYTHEPQTDRTANGSGTYATMLYSGEALQPWEPYEVRTDYATTFYTGVLNAATQAYNDLADVVSVSGGIMDTTSGGLQFNYVRNKTLYTADDLVNVAGMITDNHRTVSKADESKYIKGYESEVDVTMQLVKYERADKIIVLSNFQSHPHLGDGSNNLNPTGGVVESFRSKLTALFATENKKCEVLYFSGAGGNVNSSGRVSGEAEKYAWDGKTLTGNAIDQKFQQVHYHGVELSKLAHAFLKDTSKLTVTVDPATANVQARVQNFTYDVWDETKTYTMGEVTVQPTWSDVKMENAKFLVNWEEGGYLNRPGTFTEDDTFVDTVNNPKELSYWEYFCGTQTGNDRIYSYFHANGVRKRVMAKGTTGEFLITAYDLGGIGFIAAPYEMFQENGQAIKGNVKTALTASQSAKYADFPDYITNGCGYIPGEDGQYKTSPYGITIIASQANAAQGYIPSVLGYKNGGYATDTSLFAPGTGEQLVTAYVDMLNALHAAQ